MKSRFRTSTRILALLFFACCLCWWWFGGSNTGWTKTYITAPTTDEVTGIVYEVKQEKFVPGIDCLAVGTGLSFVVFAASFLRFPKP